MNPRIVVQSLACAAVVVLAIVGCEATTGRPPAERKNDAPPSSAAEAAPRGANSRDPQKRCRVNPPVPLFEGRLRIDSASCVDVDGRLDEWSSLVESDATPSAGRSTFATALATDDRSRPRALRADDARALRRGAIACLDGLSEDPSDGGQNLRVERRERAEGVVTADNPSVDFLGYARGAKPDYGALERGAVAPTCP